MHDDTYSGYDALLDLVATWQARLDAERSIAASALTEQRDGRGRSPIADRQLAHRVIEHSTAAGVLRIICDEAQGLVDDIEARLASFERAPSRGASGPASAGDDGSPVPSEPVP